jgi:hypothetical protein
VLGTNVILFSCGLTVIQIGQEAKVCSGLLNGLMWAVHVDNYLPTVRKTKNEC